MDTQVEDLLIGRRYRSGAMRSHGGEAMSLTVPVVALTALIVLSLIAREWKYYMTAVGLIVVTGVLAVWFGTMNWMYG
jgi:hypothetical protein